MKRIAAFAALALLVASPRANALDEASVVVAGKVRSSVELYDVGQERYLSAKASGDLYGAQVYWYPVAGRVELTLRGHTLQLLAGSDQARLDGKALTLPAPVLLRSTQAWLPLSFLKSKTFSDWAGADTAFDAGAMVLTVDRRGTLGPVRWYSYKAYTRLALNLGPEARYTTSARGVGGVQASVPFAWVDSPERQPIADGIVKSYELTQGPRAGQLSVHFARQGLKWRAHELANPRRLVIDVFAGDVVDTDDAPAQASEAQTPPAAAPVAASTAAALSAAAAAVPAAPKDGRRIVVIDAGHGGKDPGATGWRGLREKDITIKAAKELAAIFRGDPHFKVILTRDDDTFIPLSDRSKTANDAGADLFISLHCNANDSRREEGYEVYFLSEKASDPEAEQLAQQENSVVALEGNPQPDMEADLLLGELAKTEYVNESSELAGLVNRELARRVDIEERGVKQAGFYVLRGTHAPAILFEMAFVTNPKDALRLQSKRFRRSLELGVYEGVMDYARRKGWFTSAVVEGK